MHNHSLIVTYALPYANGSLHLGHMLGMIQTDIWVRFQKMRDQRCYFFCGDDAHGTPIMLRAQNEGVTPEALIARIYTEHTQDLADFNIGFDNFYTTHSPENQALASEIYQRLDANKHIATRTIAQAFDPEKNMFLPDRFIKGTCPKCKTPDQYGDNCEACGATYSPNDLINPVSALSGATPIQKETEHYFFKLPDFKELLEKWTTAGHLQKEVSNKLKEWFEAGLQDWDITRDAPYFGFTIPGHDDKYFYVWLDAPIGYFSSMKNYAQKNPEFDFNAVIKPDSTTELYHFIGKDIIYFHALFWPAMLAGSGHRTPTAIFAHGFMTVNGQKMSKSRGTFITARRYLELLDPEYLRYYAAAKLGSGLDDLDFNLEDFTARINSDLIGKFVNIASRCASFLRKNYNNTLANALDNPALIDKMAFKSDEIAALYESREYSKAMREIMNLADEANGYIAQAAPWSAIKDPANAERVHQICTTAINAFRLLALYLQPVMPKLVEKAAAFLNEPLTHWSQTKTVLLSHPINDYEPLLHRIDFNEVRTMITPDAPAVELPALIPPLAEEITIDDFMKVDLRIARIAQAEAVPEADKLVKLQLDLGKGGTRQVFAGIKSAYNPEDLVGKLTVMVANLKPRQMRFGMSEGMVLAASGEASGIYILEPHAGAEPGMRVK
jgi:methionyl-tRNA synthetase